MEQPTSRVDCDRRAGVPFLFLTVLLAAMVSGAAAVAEDMSPPSLRPPEVNPAVDKSIENGLRFLARVQKRDGSYGKWSMESIGGQTYPTAMSSLAGLCFLASGSTPSRGPYARNIESITKYLLENCTDNPETMFLRNRGAPGLISNPRAMEERTMYCHAFGMTFLGLVFGHERDHSRRERIRKVLHRAVDLTRRSQTYRGGWGYTPDYRNDEGTLVVTQLQALRTCRDAGIFVPKNVIDDGVKYIMSSTNDDGSVRYRPTSSPSNTRPGVTSAAVVALWQAGRYDDPLFRRITDYVNRYLVHRYGADWRYGHHAEYVLYYLSQSQHVLGGETWNRYYTRVSAMLLSEQRRDGSWEGKDDGDIYGTTIALLILQLPYNRLPVYQR